MTLTAEQIAAQAAVDAAKVAGADGDNKDADVVVQSDPVVEAARTKGWKPKEEFTGDPGTWVDAKEFLGREPLFEGLRTIRRENKELKRTLDAVSRHINKTVEHQVMQRINELNYQKKEAVKTGDVAQVEAIDAAIEKEKERKAEVTAAPKSEVSPEVETWVEANPWYLSDAEMRDFAYTHNSLYMKRHPGDVANGLKITADAVRKAFPDRFPKPPVKPPEVGNGEDGKGKAPVVEGGGAPPGGGGKKYAMNRLSADQRRVYDQIVTEHKVTTHDAFFKSLEEIGELR